jgi:hypothetical protein
MEDFDLPFAYEALARAHGLAGDEGESRRYKDLARAAGEALADDDDRRHFAKSLTTL